MCEPKRIQWKGDTIIETQVFLFDKEETASSIQPASTPSGVAAPKVLRRDSRYTRNDIRVNQRRLDNGILFEKILKMWECFYQDTEEDFHLLNEATELLFSISVPKSGEPLVCRKNDLKDYLETLNLPEDLIDELFQRLEDGDGDIELDDDVDDAADIETDDEDDTSTGAAETDEDDDDNTSGEDDDATATTIAHTEFLFPPTKTQAMPLRINTLLTGYHRPQKRIRPRTYNGQVPLPFRPRPSSLVQLGKRSSCYDPKHPSTMEPSSKRRRVGETSSCELKRAAVEDAGFDASYRLAKRPRLTPCHKKRVLLRVDATATSPATPPLASITAALLEFQALQEAMNQRNPLPAPDAQVPQLSRVLGSIREEEEEDGEDSIIGDGANDNDVDDEAANDDQGSTNEDDDGSSTITDDSDDATVHADAAAADDDDAQTATAMPTSDDDDPFPSTDDATTASDGNQAGTTTTMQEPSPAFSPPPNNDSGTGHDLEPSPVEHTMHGHGSMYISDLRYPTHVAVRRSCRVAERKLYREGMYKC